MGLSSGLVGPVLLLLLAWSSKESKVHAGGGGDDAEGAEVKPLSEDR